MMLIMPVANGILPRPLGGRITGMFVIEQGGQLLIQAGVGQDVLICPWSVDDQALYPVGVIARINEITQQKLVDENAQEYPVYTAVLEGRGHARWHTLRTSGPYLVSPDIEAMKLKESRKDYPVISGAGWLPAGGYTEFRGESDIPVTIYGTDLERGKEVSITANLGGLVTQEQAHTIEHGIIRALRGYGLCTPKTLLDAMARETDELKQSVELGIRFSLPEIIGRTATGACGNPMSNLAQFYMAQEFVDNIADGKSLNESVIDARRRALSQLTGELGLTTREGTRATQGLKKGMSHDDTRLKLDICKRVISRFPFAPWD